VKSNNADGTSCMDGKDPATTEAPKSPGKPLDAEIEKQIGVFGMMCKSGKCHYDKKIGTLLCGDPKKGAAESLQPMAFVITTAVMLAGSWSCFLIS